MIDRPFILASQSPRRRALLERLGWRFRVVPSNAEEVIPPGAVPEGIVQALARLKAEEVAARFDDALTLGADTVVVLDGEILGKPADDDEAGRMLRRLRDRSHTVYTGIALVHPPSGRVVTAAEATRVTFGPMTDAEIDAYVATGSPRDKAGAYGIQDDRGALFVAGVEGDYYNVVGLPLHRLYRTLRERFSDLLA